MNYYYHGIKTTLHPPPALALYFYMYCVSSFQYVTIYMYIPNFMKPALHNCINKYV